MWSKVWSKDLFKIILLRRQVRGGNSNATRGTGSHSQAGEVKSWKITESCQNIMQIIFSLAKSNKKTLFRYQGSLVALERQATDLMQEIKATHTRSEKDAIRGFKNPLHLK